MHLYRGGLCELCEEAATTRCSRCACAMCVAHGPRDTSLCVLCVKEYKDDLDVKRFASDAAVPAVDNSGAFGGGADTQLITWLAKSIRSLFEPKPPPQKDFASRSVDDIAAWRRSAGVRTRSGN